MVDMLRNWSFIHKMRFKCKLTQTDVLLNGQLVQLMAKGQIKTKISSKQQLFFLWIIIITIITVLIWDSPSASGIWAGLCRGYARSNKVSVWFIPPPPPHYKTLEQVNNCNNSSYLNHWLNQEQSLFPSGMSPSSLHCLKVTIYTVSHDLEPNWGLCPSMPWTDLVLMEHLIVFKDLCWSIWGVSGWQMHIHKEGVCLIYSSSTPQDSSPPFLVIINIQIVPTALGWVNYFVCFQFCQLSIVPYFMSAFCVTYSSLSFQVKTNYPFRAFGVLDTPRGIITTVVLLVLLDVFACWHLRLLWANYALVEVEWRPAWSIWIHPGLPSHKTALLHSLHFSHPCLLQASSDLAMTEAHFSTNQYSVCSSIQCSVVASNIL